MRLTAAGVWVAANPGNALETSDGLLDWASLPKLPPENDLSRRYLRILERWIPTGVSYYGEWPDRPNCGHFFGGAHWYGLETAWPAEVFACAASSPDYDETATGVPREELIRMAISAVRFLCFTHDTGPADCVRPSPPKAHAKNAGTKWGERGRGRFPESQCTWSIGPMTRVCALLHDRIDEETLEMVVRVLEDYAGRFDETDPWEGVYANTQTEENGWTAWGLASVATLLARHERADHWMDCVREWSFCIATTPQDGMNRGSIGETPIQDYWRRRITTLPDYWAENHGMAHPTYTASGILFAANIATQLRLFGRDIPEEVTWNRREVYENLKRTADDYGFMLAPQGMDWNWLPGLAQGGIPHSYASVFLEDPIGAVLESRALKQAEARLESFGGRFYDAEIANRADDIQDPLFLRELAINTASWGYLLHRLFGPGTPPLEKERVERELAGARVWNHAGIAHNRHARGQTSFSWRNSIMALPVTREGSTLIGPASGSFLGQPTIKDRPASQHLVSCEVDRREKGFAAALVMDRAQASLRQFVLFASLPDGRTLSFERFEALEDLTAGDLSQGELSVVNETFSAYPSGNCRGERVLHTPEEAKVFEGHLGESAEEDRLVPLGHPAWLNIDDRIGFVFQGTGEASYLNRRYHKPYYAIHDRLVLSLIPADASFKAGETVTQLGVVVLPEQGHEETGGEWLEVFEPSRSSVALLTREALAVANFEDSRSSVAFEVKAKGPFQIFPGVVSLLDKATCRYSTQVPANRAVYYEAYATLSSDGPLETRATVGGGLFLTNPGPAAVEADIEREEQSRVVTIEPGETISL